MPNFANAGHGPRNRVTAKPLFEEMADAFGYCREKDKPVKVDVFTRGATFKLYPCGRAVRLFHSCPDCIQEIKETIPLDHGTCHGCGRYWGRACVTEAARVRAPLKDSLCCSASFPLI